MSRIALAQKQLIVQAKVWFTANYVDDLVICMGVSGEYWCYTILTREAAASVDSDNSGEDSTLKQNVRQQ